MSDATTFRNLCVRYVTKTRDVVVTLLETNEIEKKKKQASARTRTFVFLMVCKETCSLRQDTNSFFFVVVVSMLKIKYDWKKIRRKKSENKMSLKHVETSYSCDTFLFY